MRKLVSVLVVAFLVASSAATASAAGQESRTYGASPEAVALDVVALRPFGLAESIVGTAAFLVTLPVTAPMGKAREAGDAMVMGPLHYTFERPLGQM